MVEEGTFRNKFSYHLVDNDHDESKENTFVSEVNYEIERCSLFFSFFLFF